jgi:hypothetical protein
MLFRDGDQSLRRLAELDLLLGFDAASFGSDAREQAARFPQHAVAKLLSSAGNTARARDDRHLRDVNECETGREALGHRFGAASGFPSASGIVDAAHKPVAQGFLPETNPSEDSRRRHAVAIRS